jgi:sulfur-carrier protein
MATAFIRLPLALVGQDAPQRLECTGSTVREALRDCVAREPRLEKRIFREDGAVWVGIFVNGQNAARTGGLDAPIADGDEIKLMPPVSGG